MMQSRKAVLEGVNLLELAPRRTASWDEKDGRVVLRLEPPPSWWQAPLAWLNYKISIKIVRLDEVGSFAWKRLDGRHTVAQVAEELRLEFGERVEPAEERLGELVRHLHRGGKIAYSSDDEVEARAKVSPDRGR